MKISEIYKPNPGSRKAFEESWLSESPMKTSPVDYYQNLVSAIKGIKKFYRPVIISDKWRKIQGTQVAYYYYQIKNIIVLGAEFDITPESLIIRFVAKNKEFKQQPPYASDLYNVVLTDLKKSDKSIRVDSDTRLSDEGFSVWKKLLTLGKTISVYDITNPGQTFTNIKNVKDLEKYFDEDPTFEKYRYVLTETASPIARLKNSFKLRETREINNDL